MKAQFLPRADALDTLLLVVFMFGIATGIDFRLGPGLPVPAAVAGLAAILMLIRHLNLIRGIDLRMLLVLVLIFSVSVLAATDYSFLNERFKGLIQLIYSLVIAYGVFLTFLLYDREQLSRVFLIASILIVIGTALETYTSFRAISDAFRNKVYSFGVYESDLRDMMLYGGIRPKLFTSEPSAISFAFLLFTFCWYALSRIPGKIVGYIGLLGAGYFLMKGPTLLLGLPLAGVYELFLAPRATGPNAGKINAVRVIFGVIACAILGFLFITVGATLFSERLKTILNNTDASFFFRVIGPALVAIDTIKDFPFTGAGLTGEEFIEDRVWQIYFNSPLIALGGRADRISSTLTNYFWLHWIYLGLGFGTIVLFAVNLWLRKLGARSVVFCWVVWVTLGQASGAYVSPKTWCVLLIAAAITVLHERAPIPRYIPAPGPRPMRPAVAGRPRY